MKSAEYFERFNRGYSFCINQEFEQVYATSSTYSWSSEERFKRELCEIILCDVNDVMILFQYLNASR